MKLDAQGLVEGQDFIVFGEDFARHPHSLEHTLRPLFSENRFIWVETIGLRSPKLSVYDLKRIFEKFKSWFSPKAHQADRVIPETITVVSPFMIPFNKIKVVRAFNKYSVKKAVRKAIQDCQFSNIVTVASVPNACDYVGIFNEKLKVFVCVDEFSLWPGLDYDMVRKMEQNLLAKSDLVFATSDSLARAKSNGKKETVLLTHGVEFEHFNIGPKKSSGSLKLCYFGLFDERSDQNILAEIAQSIPEAEIQIFGKVVCDAKRLQSFGNIKFMGSVSYESLPKAIQDVDVFLLPYVRNELTENINPLKLKEYLSTRRPVIATALPEVVKFKDYLEVAANGQEFVNIIRRLQEQGLTHDSTATLKYLEANETWKAKARLFSQQLAKF